MAREAAAIRNVVLGVRLNAREAAHLELAAKSDGLSASSWVREVALEEAVKRLARYAVEQQAAPVGR